MSRQRPGRTRVRLAELLAGCGLIVEPGELWTQEGANRHSSAARWGTHRARWKDGRTPDGSTCGELVTVSSWDTMTDCVRHGVGVRRDGPSWNQSWRVVDVFHQG